jgi:hypothetical protein
MKRKFIITEVVTYELEAETKSKAEEIFLNSDNNDPITLKIGDQVNVDAHNEHDEDFSGIIIDIDTLHGYVTVKAPDGEEYDCDHDYVYAPGEAEASSGVEGEANCDLTKLRA